MQKACLMVPAVYTRLLCQNKCCVFDYVYGSNDFLKVSKSDTAVMLCTQCIARRFLLFSKSAGPEKVVA